MNYRVVVGDQKTINEEFQRNPAWKPILMSTVPFPSVPNGTVITVILERVGEQPS